MEDNNTTYSSDSGSQDRPIFALTLSTTASFLSALSFMLMKLANISVEKLVQRRPDAVFFRRIVYFHPFWLTGILACAAGQILNTYALNYASVILLSSTCCFTIIFNSVLAPYFLGENFRFKSDGVTILMLITGSLMCLLQEPKKNNDSFEINRIEPDQLKKIVHSIKERKPLEDKSQDIISVHDALYIMTEPQTLFTIISIFALHLASIYLRSCLKRDLNGLYDTFMGIYKNDEVRDRKSGGRGLREPLTPVEESNKDRPSEREMISIVENINQFLSADVILSIKNIDIISLNLRQNRLLVIYAVLSGLYSGLSTTITKLLIEVLNGLGSTIDEYDPIRLIGVLSILIVWSMVFNIVILNQAISIYSQLKVVPAYQSFVILGNLMTGGIILNEFSEYSFESLLYIVVGTFTCIIGIYVKICIDYQSPSIKINQNVDYLKPREDRYDKLVEILMQLQSRQKCGGDCLIKV